MPKIFPNKIIRSRRRTLALSITSDATLVVRAPMRTPVEYIEEFIAKHTHWITRKLAQVSSKPKIFMKPEWIIWYKQQAQELISERTEVLAAQMGVQYASIRITNAQHRWGSCSHHGNLNFTWRLILAPIEVIDCVIVHELAHITEKNHSSRFWARVQTFAPDYKSLHKWLKNNDSLLGI